MFPESTYNTLEKALFSNASRYGTSAFRLGFIPEAPSDHLPIIAHITHDDAPPISLVSWNLLADTHLYNNFMNITGTKAFFGAIAEKGNIDNNLYCAGGTEEKNRLYHYFSELAKFLYAHKRGNVITINPGLLEDFSQAGNVVTYFSHLTRSRSPEETARKQAQLLHSRAEMSAILMDPTHPHHHEFQLAIQHSMELYYHVEHGALKWQQHRFPLIKHNHALVKTLYDADFLCFQECTSPQDFQKADGDFQGLDHEFITHKTDPKTNDHCVLAYNPEKFELISKPIFGALENKKPYIIGQFRNKETHKMIIVGSLHYPGGEHHYTQEILDLIAPLQATAGENIDFFIAGDYNHTQDFFDQHAYNMHYPTLGTMAGSDYNNTNLGIDAVLTGKHNSSTIAVERVACLSVTKPAKKQLDVRFDRDYPKENRPSSLPSIAATYFGKKVQSTVTKEEADQVLDAFASSRATLSGRPTL